MKISRHPALLLVLVGICALTGCHGATHKARSRTLRCRLQVSGRRGGRAVVTYDDVTGDPAMSAAIKTEVSAWNSSTAPVLLQSSSAHPAITFRAVSSPPTFAGCSSSAPRVVSVELSKPKWHAAPGAAGAIKDPAGAIAKDIASALGLASAGKCPQLTSPDACPHRAQVPGRTETKLLQQLYG